MLSIPSPPPANNNEKTTRVSRYIHIAMLSILLRTYMSHCQHIKQRKKVPEYLVTYRPAQCLATYVRIVSNYINGKKYLSISLSPCCSSLARAGTTVCTSSTGRGCPSQRLLRVQEPIFRRERDPCRATQSHQFHFRSISSHSIFHFGSFMKIEPVFACVEEGGWGERGRGGRTQLLLP